MKRFKLRTFYLSIVMFIVLLYLELIFRMFNNIDIFNISLLYVIVFNIFMTILICIIGKLFNRKVNKIMFLSGLFLLGFLYSVQLCVFKMFGFYFDWTLIGASGQIASFAGDGLNLIIANIIGLILNFMPFILFLIYNRIIVIEKDDVKANIVKIVLCVLTGLSFYGVLNIKRDEVNSPYKLYTSVNNVDLNVRTFGVVNAFFIDTYRNVFGFEEIIDIPNKPKDDVNNNDGNDNVDVKNYEYNNLDIDFDKLISSESNKTIKAMHEYFKSESGTKENMYTGYFKGKNLILFMAESFNEIAVREDLTPTLYKLTNNGFIFDNFYVPYYLSTIGGEFQSLTGLYPNYSTLTKWKSGENSFPYGLATVFKEKGYNTYAYHAHDGYFQNRYKYLKALGFDNFKACNMGLNINCNMWPESDIEMIKATTNDYINSDKPFMTYYMTVSGHLDYTKEGNSIVSKNWDLVKNLDYSDKAKSYLATQIELDRAMESLLKELENKGILEDTVIVLLADHYPYGLSLEEINELSSYKRDELFEINHNALIIYNSSMKNISITKVGMPIDVLPTIYNLFDIKYDSRLFAGSDLLSNNEGMVILDNLSWITDKGKYNSLNGKYSGDIDSDYINNINNIIQNKIIFSRNMITYDGYRYIKEK